MKPGPWERFQALIILVLTAYGLCVTYAALVAGVLILLTVNHLRRTS